MISLYNLTYNVNDINIKIIQLYFIILNNNILSNKNFKIFRSEFAKIIIYGKLCINKEINLNKTTKKIKHYRFGLSTLHL